MRRFVSTWRERRCRTIAPYGHGVPALPAHHTDPARMTLDQGLFLLILGGGLYLFVSERLRVDVTAMLLLLALVLAGLLDARQALSGFASEPALIVAAVFVISGGLSATGVTERLGRWIGRAAGHCSESRAIAVVMPAVAALSAFTHHVMVTAMMLPLLLKHGRENRLPASRLLMPMSLAASLGTTPDPGQRAGVPARQRHARAQRQRGSACSRSPRSALRWCWWASLHAVGALAAAAARRARRGTTTCAWTATAPNWWW